MNIFSIDVNLYGYIIIGIFTGIVVTLDGYARGHIITPTLKCGKIDKGRTIALYISIILFSSLASIIMGTIAIEMELGNNVGFIMAGLGGILGRDLIHLLSDRLLNRVNNATELSNKKKG